MKNFIRCKLMILSFVLILILVLLPAGSAAAGEIRLSTDQSGAQAGQTGTMDGDDIAKVHDLIRDIIRYYGSFGNEPGGPVEELLLRLESIDPVQAELWDGIIDYWDYVNDEMPVYDEVLPEDLPDDDTMCIIVLGFELNDDGTMQDELLGRLETALSCSGQYPEAYVLCTGGGTARENDQVTEAGLMGEWLIEHGLDKDRLIIEDQSHTTAQNALFSYDILREDYPQVDSIVLVSSHYHIPWGTLLFEAAFRKTAAEQNTPEIHVISNCAYPILNEKYKDVLRFETGGMLQLIEEDMMGYEYYSDTYTKPEYPLPEEN